MSTTMIRPTDDVGKRAEALLAALNAGPQLRDDDHNRHIAAVATARAASMLALELERRGLTAGHPDHRTATQVFRAALRTYMDTLQSGGLR